ncbi:MAG TPA: GNAT family N-acetyltransferase [Micromonosporaceae bacterium]|nr:GNAT family N-acetyltransferase [Micromonosporaceae bacterium]
MDLLPSGETHRVRHLFEPAHLTLVIDGVAAGNTPARVWADDSGGPRSAMVWDGTHNLYFTGDLDRAGAWRDLFDRDIAPACTGILKVHTDDASAAAVFGGLPMRRRERVFYRRDPRPVPDWRQALPAGYRVTPIHDGYDDLSALANAADVTSEIGLGWHSVTDFRRAGFGFAAHTGDAIVCWCTAEFVSDGKCGIGIETVPEHQGRGLATLTATAFVEHCAARGITAHWDAWADNLSSVAVAEKVGFRLVERYPALVGDFAGLRA